MKLKDTLALPRTDFPMRAGLPKREPERLARWESSDLYERIREARRDRPRYILHDGPPYANGHVHLGTALNKILKDFVVKARSQAGHDSPFVPGWDCHGMPIEHQVLRELREQGAEASPREIRRHCREFALRFLDVQREEFRRLGVFGRWDDPYLTLDPAYEAAILEAFGRLHADGYIYKGMRSIHWCPTCRTALANAEVGYDDQHESTTIWVRFDVTPGEKATALGLPAGAAVLIWTTTPWTIPANVAIAVHPTLEYVLVEGDGRQAVVAKDRLEAVAAELGWTTVSTSRSFSGAELEGLLTRHPLVDCDSPVVLADYVTTDAGTGAVHTAPGHGEEDFETGQRYGLPILVPVDKSGRFTEEAGPRAGQHVFAANPGIVEDLREAGALAGTGTLEHAYPTCWRCRGDLIFLATEQWFLNVENEGLRERCLEQVEQTQWVPPWGRDRMRDSVTSRPDWCLSRQRAWGVPIPAFRCSACDEAVLNEAILEHVVSLVAEHGTDVWFDRPVAELAPAGTNCPKCGSAELETDGNILDVWFDASCSHLAVLASGRWPELTWPADLYLEAVDQHRGWFQVSLLNAVALQGQAPYRSVLTHGLILDESSHKMSKSLGNVIAPEEILESHGADVLRLLFASVDSTADVPFSRDQLGPVAESYRKIRNTWRFLLGNLRDFQPDEHAVPVEQMPELDCQALHSLWRRSGRVRAAWDELSFHSVHRLLLGYLTTDVSAFLAVALKDRLYADAPDSLARRSAQTVLFEVARETAQLFAPVLCFTSDEFWEHLPDWNGKTDGVHVATWPALPDVDEELLDRWQAILEVRDDVLKALEVARVAKVIGDSLEADLTLGVPEDRRDLLESLHGELAAVFAVSEVRLESAGEPPPSGGHVSSTVEGLWVGVQPSSGTKCPRCWNRRTDGGGVAGHPDICGRCAEVLARMNVELDPA